MNSNLEESKIFLKTDFFKVLIRVILIITYLEKKSKRYKQSKSPQNKSAQNSIDLTNLRISTLNMIKVVSDPAKMIKSPVKAKSTALSNYIFRVFIRNYTETQKYTKS